MKTVILGATRGMGRAVARELIMRGDDVFLLGRDLDEIRQCAQDLEARSGKAVAGCALCNLAEPAGFEAVFAAAKASLGRIDTVVITAAAFGSQEALEANLDKTADLLTLDFTNTILFCERARPYLLEGGGGVLCVFSSVAGDRGRKPVILYGAAKAGLSAYLEGLDHKFHAAGLGVVCVKPGFVKTAMTAGLKPPPFAGEAEDVARTVVRAIDRRTPVVYAPGMWRWVMLVIRCLPRFVMRKIGF